MASASQQEFVNIAVHLAKRREQILSRWRHAVGDDPKVGAAASLARAQFVDHIPRILDAFDRKLRARSPESEAAAEADQLAGAAEHGEHRWLHGYNSRETLREWGHLQLCMLSELESFALEEANTDVAVMREARAMLTQLFVDCMVESASSHAALERAEAEGRLRELERVLQRLRIVERDRTELWREAAHDLRGNVGAVKLAANALGRAVATPELPAFVNLVRKSADSLGTLLNDLIELARLEAGREQRIVARFNVHTEISDLCESLQPLAASRRLSLRFAAPAVLIVAGDAVKVRRIAQNLILNAINYTERGEVLVSCEEIQEEVRSWALLVQDTGVGLNHDSSGPLTQALTAATREAHAITGEASSARQTGDRAVPPKEREGSDQPREGIGLSIVKRLCELLDASLELESRPGLGTTFRIIFPSQYSA